MEIHVFTITKPKIYNQDHYQLHWSESISEKWSTNFAFHYKKGKGYFENYKEDADMAE
ncbi:hypothetical protein ACFFWB_14845 [Flavobacterium procerum]|uniref:hypothetical protein n=1 Tax=Flavobacterium procerum TaxID=1455569 RepID=UPI0035E76C19